MKIRLTHVLLTAIALTVLLGTATASWAACPTSPNYTPDFTSNQSCMTLNGSASFFSTTTLRLTPNTTGQAGSAWFTAQQPVAAAFSTTFKFQLGNPSEGSLGNADGIAFVIQNSALTALGPDGCGIGFGGSSICTAGNGIPKSLAVEFNTFNNGTGVDPSSSDVTIQNCSGTGANSVDQSCRLAGGVNDLTLLPQPINLADGNVHTATVTYKPPTASGCGEGGTSPCPGSLDVILDNVDLFPNGVAFDLSMIGLNNGNAWVGFTAATGGGDDNQDILSWVFTPQAQSVVVTGNGATLSFQNAANNSVYDYTAKLTSGNPVDVQVKPVLVPVATCNAIVQKSFWPARCFVYENAEDTGLSSAVMFEVTCPQPGNVCNNFFALLGTDWQFSKADNPFFTYPGIVGLLNPFPGLLKGDGGPDPLRPCTPPAVGALFQSNQIDTFFIDGGHTVGNSGGGSSCYVATYDTPGELPPGIKITAPAFTTYTQNQAVTATYTCSNPTTSKPEFGPSPSPVGPYLTVASCTQNQLPVPKGFNNANSCMGSGQTTGKLTCTGPVDTSILGLHAFTVTAIDTGGNTNVQAVIYTVVKKH